MAGLVKQNLETKLSPLSRGKMTALQKPTKVALGDFDKALSSSESTVRKALVSLNKMTTTSQQCRERSLAQAARTEELKAKKIQEATSALDKAREEGRAIADKEADVRDNDEQGEENKDDGKPDDEPLALLADNRLLVSEPVGGLPNLSELLFDPNPNGTDSEHPAMQLMAKHQDRATAFRKENHEQAMQKKLDVGS